ncbi:pro-pol protein [Moniliophthora roreri MCA 2997]|uniref:Pro-pol protein n=1 Tax=Moniliophthora roreri (strain MCA 2997) TaxID=1381753 RepID=V2W1R4_MONRO|nr:pro-pol protein [Moniliophthora roreri MCA 2997]
MDPIKLAGIHNWPAPEMLKGVQSFTGFANFYRKFISRYAEIAKPLYDLTKKGVPFSWTTECQKAFTMLKGKFLEEPLLLISDSSKPFVIESDASKWASGAVLQQKEDDGEWHPCGFISHAFDAMERNYKIYDQELFAIIRALETWRHYIQGSGHPKLNRRQVRWSLFLSLFNLKLVHVPRTQMVQSDTLSRRSDYILTINTDNKDIVMLPEVLFINIVDLDLQQKLKDALGADNFHWSTLESLLDQGVPPIKSSLSDWKIDDNILFYREKVYVPNDVTLQ